MVGLTTSTTFDFLKAERRLTPPQGVVIAQSFEEALEFWKQPEVRIVVISGSDKIPEDVAKALSKTFIGEQAKTSLLVTDKLPPEHLGANIAKQLLDYDFAQSDSALFAKACALFTRAANFFAQIRTLEGSSDPAVLMMGHNWPYNPGPHRDKRCTMAYTLQGITTMTFADSDIANLNSPGRIVRLKPNAQPYFVDLCSFAAIKAEAPHGTPWIKGWQAPVGFTRVSGVFN